MQGALAIVVAVVLGCGSRAPEPTIANTAPAGPPPTVLRDDWQDACRRILAETAAGFRSKAPAIYPPYKQLLWGAEDDDEPEAAFPSVTIAPGRSWKFSAFAMTDDDRVGAFYGDLAVTDPQWTAVPDRDATYARRAGAVTLMIVVETERSAVEVAQHPLVVEFVARMQAALDRCAA